MFLKVTLLALFSTAVFCIPYNKTAYFIDMILDNISAAQKYVLPTNNQDVYTNSQDITTYGSFDFIIVGAGSAGTVLANRLSEITHWKILLLEAGREQNDFSDFPGVVPLMTLTDMNWGYNSTPQTTCCLGMNNKSCSAVRGKVIGGSSSINARMYVRGNKDDYNSWEKMGNPGWSYKKVLPYFIKSENFHQNEMWPADLQYHGRNGYLSVNYTEPNPFTSIFLEACQRIGLPIIDYNGRRQIGAGKIQFNIEGIKLESGGRAFLDPIRHKRKNLNVTTNAFVTKVLIDKSKIAYGVEFIKNHKKYVAKASKEVILSGGTFNTPQVLMLSGIGPKDQLNKLGIPVITDLPVGKNLEDHSIYLGLNFRTNQSLYVGKSIVDLLKDYLNGHPPFTYPFNIDCQCFINVNNEKSSVPDIQLLLFTPSGVRSFANDVFNLAEAYLDEGMDPHNDIQIRVVLLRPKSKGSVTLKSGNASDFPNIDYNLLAEDEDMATMYKGVLKVLEIIETEPFKAVNATLVHLFKGCEEYEEFSKEYWYCSIRMFSTQFYHPIGTTRMGVLGKNSVVDSNLLVHGTKKLRVVDAGVIPRITSGNTNAPTYMIAEKMSDEIKDYYLLKTYWDKY